MGKKQLQRHPFHLIPASELPSMLSLYVLVLVIGLVSWMHGYVRAEKTILLGLFFVLITVSQWLDDVILEGTYLGNHTLKVQKGLRYGMVLFIVSEVMFFFGFFWAFFASSLAPTIEIGGIWPPIGLTAMDPFGVPLLNTFILLLSGITVTRSHEAIIEGKRGQATSFLFITIALAIAFTLLQVMEYIEASFSITDSIYGSTFYMATGFHGFHVMMGSVFLIVSLHRLVLGHFTRDHHFGFEAAAWYWHFVDVVWIFLFISIYWWGSL